ncbi:MAG: GNAT family N-acetyltransferase [Deltaproteobacteria bacterium]|nr:GNAT family N-acetyltransferase [Deltaproteobacteria bacterium]
MVDKQASGLSIRVATASDSTLLAEVGTETFSDSFAAENTPENMAIYLTESFGPERQASELADPASRFLIIESDGLTVGYAHIRFGEAPPCIAGKRPMEIKRFYVRKAWIGKGVGARLMQACVHEAAGAGCDVIWLDVWERNARAIAFYREWGFVEMGTQPFRLGDDLQRDLLMVRAVDRALA